MKRNSGLAFHSHHDRLHEFVYDYKERAMSIKANKPKEEQELRLRLFKLIPLNRLPLALRKVAAEWEKAYAEWKKAECEKTDAECEKVAAEWRKSDAEYNLQLEKLHEEICPNCPWDGSTIFTRKDGDGRYY